MEGGHDAAAGKHIPAFVVLERLFECGDDGVDDSSDVVIVIDAIEIVIDVFEGPHWNQSEVFIVLLIVMRRLRQ